ncbi:beta-phosphoglucomutase [Firmicutes bacterium i23-0019-B6]
MKYKAVIFDLDGVICSTDEYHYKAWKKLADKMNISFDRKVNERLRGVSRMESLEIILKNYHGNMLSREEKDKLTEEKNQIYRESLSNMSEKDLSSEVKETLELLHNMGLKLAIGSSSKNTKYILKQIGLESFFDAISDGTNIKKSKPDPEVFLKAAEFIHENPENCLVVEDAEAGIDAAIAGHFDSAGIGTAVAHGKATYRLNSFQEIIKIVIGES